MIMAITGFRSAKPNPILQARSTTAIGGPLGSKGMLLPTTLSVNLLLGTALPGFRLEPIRWDGSDQIDAGAVGRREILPSLQLDPWWYVEANPSDHGCGLAVNWSANPLRKPICGGPRWRYRTLLELSILCAVWPEGLAATGVPLTLYSSYFARVADGNVMTAYTWTDSVYINVGWFVGYISQVHCRAGCCFCWYEQGQL